MNSTGTGATRISSLPRICDADLCRSPAEDCHSAKTRALWLRIYGSLRFACDRERRFGCTAVRVRVTSEEVPGQTGQSDSPNRSQPISRLHSTELAAIFNGLDEGIKTAKPLCVGLLDLYPSRPTKARNTLLFAMTYGEIFCRGIEILHFLEL